MSTPAQIIFVGSQKTGEDRPVYSSISVMQTPFDGYPPDVLGIFKGALDLMKIKFQRQKSIETPESHHESLAMAMLFSSCDERYGTRYRLDEVMNFTDRERMISYLNSSGSWCYLYVVDCIQSNINVYKPRKRCLEKSMDILSAGVLVDYRGHAMNLFDEAHAAEEAIDTYDGLIKDLEERCWTVNKVKDPVDPRESAPELASHLVETSLDPMYF